jgi:predicted nucleotidyltransferase
MTHTTNHTKLAQTIAKRFKSYPQVEAIALGGSLTSGNIDHYSDIDLYIYTTKEVPVVDRKKIVDELGASRQDLGLTFWDSGDEWFHGETGIEVDIIFWDPKWIEEQIDRVVIEHQASVGYTTCFWHTIKNSKILFDRKGWFTGLQGKSDTPYPVPLKANIIAKNFPILRDVIPSYYYQIKKAIDRDDKISINHRVAAFLASYFDVLFALNEVTNPGEKKILPYALDHCSKLPPDMSSQIDELLFASSANPAGLLAKLDELIEGFERLMDAESV